MLLIQHLLFAAAIIISEIILIFVFKMVLKLVSPNEPDFGKFVNRKSVVIGLMERLFILFSLISNLPQALTFFGALKIGTRLSKESESKTFNDFFLLGNIISVFCAFMYSRLWHAIDDITLKPML